VADEHDLLELEIVDDSRYVVTERSDRPEVASLARFPRDREDRG
jgi:hypothetical protein